LRWSIFAFTVIYGSLFHISFLGDGEVHWQKVYDNYQYLDFSVWWDQLILILSLNPSQNTNDDPYIHLLSYLIGAILNAPQLFWIGVAIVYGYFFSGTLVKLLGYVNWKSNYNKFFFFFFLVLFLFWKSPLAMQTVRTWTGMWVLLYAVISYFETKNRKYLLLALTPPLIHIGYVLLAFPVWVVLFSGFRNVKIYFAIFITSIFFSNFVSETGFNETIAQSSEVGAQKTKAYYLDDERAQRLAEQNELKKSDSTFYKKYESDGIQYQVMTGLIFFIFIFLRSGLGHLEKTLYCYSLAIAANANFFTKIYAAHYRSWEIACVILLILMVIILSKNNIKSMKYSFIKIKLPLFIFFIAIFPYVLYLISEFLSYSSPYIVLMPIAHWIDPDSVGMSMRQFLGELL
jgi:hypothetical protein